MNEAYEAFFNNCIAGLGDNRAICRMENNYCQIQTVKGWVVHYEWWLAQNNKLQVCLHFESGDRALNQSRYCECEPLIKTLNEKVGKKGSVTHGQWGQNWFHITISRDLDFQNGDAVEWAVSMMRVLRNVCQTTVNELN